MSDAIISNLFIKIPDISVSILSEAGTKIGCDPNELILLDVKFSDEKGILIMCTVIRGCIHNYNLYTDIEYWKVPSRKFHVAVRAD